MLYSYNEAREKMSLRKLQRRENSILYCIEKKWCVSKWTCAIQTPVVEGSAVHEKNNKYLEEKYAFLIIRLAIKY